MKRLACGIPITVFVVSLTVVSSVPARAQMRRSAPGDGAAAERGEMPKGTPRSARHPFAGVWDGSFTITGGPSGEHAIPITMILSVTDSAKSEYIGATVLPNGARAPHLETTVVSGAMRWKQENSGGGFWVYAGRIVGRDSLAGTVDLVDWPQLAPGEKPPTGTFGLIRRAPGK